FAVQDDVVEGEDLLGAAAVGAPEDRLHPRDELTRRERFRQVVVGAELEACHAVGLLVSGGQHQNRHVRARAHCPGHVEAVDARQADIEDDDPDLVPSELRERLLAGTNPDDAVAAPLQVGTGHRPDRMLVLDQKHRAAVALAGHGPGAHRRLTPVAKTWSAGLSWSRIVIAIMPICSWRKLTVRPFSFTCAPDE